MKSINELDLPEDVRYTHDHEWAKPEGDLIRVGISDYAQHQLGDVVYVELPETGSTFNKDDEFGTVESVKAVSELYMPVGGQVVEVNTELEDAPEKVNSEPYRDGWMLLVKPSDPTEVADLLERDAYLQLLKG